MRFFPPPTKESAGFTQRWKESLRRLRHAVVFRPERSKGIETCGPRTWGSFRIKSNSWRLDQTKQSRCLVFRVLGFLGLKVGVELVMAACSWFRGGFGAGSGFA